MGGQFSECRSHWTSGNTWGRRDMERRTTMPCSDWLREASVWSTWCCFRLLLASGFSYGTESEEYMKKDFYYNILYIIIILNTFFVFILVCTVRTLTMHYEAHSLYIAIDCKYDILWYNICTCDCNKSLYMFVASQVLTTEVRVSTMQQLDQNTAL